MDVLGFFFYKGQLRSDLTDLFSVSVLFLRLEQMEFKRFQNTEDHAALLGVQPTREEMKDKRARNTIFNYESGIF